MPRYAVIDIGTVTTRMLVADVHEADNGALRFDTLAKEYTITNLGEGVDSTGILKKEAIERVIQTLKRYLTIKDRFNTQGHPIEKTVVVSTSAARDAKNSTEFEQRVGSLGLKLSIIDGDEEASLSFIGATSAIDPEGEPVVLVVDIGGGSSEIGIGHPGKEPSITHSFNMGSRRLTERFIKSDPPEDDELDALRSFIREELNVWLFENSHLMKEKSMGHIDEIIAVAGTATSVVSIQKQMSIYDPDEVDGSKVSIIELTEITNMLASLDLDRRKKVIGLDPERAPVIVAGSLILEEVLSVFGVDVFTASESDILQGLAIEAYKGSRLSDLKRLA